MVLSGFLERFGAHKERLQQVEAEMKIQKMAEQKLKHSDERELERFMEERRMARIKAQLGTLRKKQTREMMTGNVFAKNDNLFEGHKSVLTNDDSQMKNSGSFMQRGNMF